MARITSAFSESFRKEEDRIDRKRKENREAFEKYREMRVKNGDQVTAQDFQNYRMSLAGGDNFMLQSMGPGVLLEDMAKRTNEQSLLTRTKEDSDFAEARKKTYELFDTFVNDNLDADPTKIAESKAKFMKLFNDNKELGEEIWAQNEGRFVEAITNGRLKEAQKFHDTFLENVHTLDEANDIMNLNGLSQWKKQAVTNIMKTKQNVFNTEVNSKAIELANNFSPSNIRFFSTTTGTDGTTSELENAVQSILEQAKVSLNAMGPTKYAALGNQIRAILKTKIMNANEAKAEADLKSFNDEIVTDSRFIELARTNGYMTKDALDIYNQLRRKYRLPEATSVDDEEYKKFAHIAQIHNRNNYGTNYQKQYDLATQKADKIIAGMNKGVNAQANGFNENSSGFIALSTLINQGNVLDPNVNPVALRIEIEKQFGEDAVKSATSDAQQIAQITAAISPFFKSAATFKEMLIQKSLVGVGFKPGSDFQQEKDIDIKDYTKDFKQFIGIERNKMFINEDPDGPRFKRIMAHIEEKANQNIDAIINQYKKSKGAFRVDSGTIEAEIEELKKELEKIRDAEMADLRSGKIRGSVLPPQSYATGSTQDRKQGIVVMKVDLVKKVLKPDGTYGTEPVKYKDSDQPVKKGDRVKITPEGDIISAVPTGQGGTSNLANTFSTIINDPAQVGKDLLNGGQQFAQFMPPSMNGQVDRNTTNREMAETIKNMYNAFKTGNVQMPPYIVNNRSVGRPVQNEFEFAQSILSQIDYYTTRRGQFALERGGIYALMDKNN